MSHTPKFKKNEFEVLMDLGFEMEVPEGDSINYADTTVKDELVAQAKEADQADASDLVDGSDSKSDINDPEEPVPGESEWSQRNRRPVEDQVDDEREDLFSLLHDRLLDHPLASQIKLDRYVRRLKLINF